MFVPVCDSEPGEVSHTTVEEDVKVNSVMIKTECIVKSCYPNLFEALHHLHWQMRQGLCVTVCRWVETLFCMWFLKRNNLPLIDKNIAFPNLSV